MEKGVTGEEEGFGDVVGDDVSGYFLTRSDIARESSSSCSKLSSAIRRLYLRACEKTILSLQLSEWLE